MEKKEKSPKAKGGKKKEAEKQMVTVKGFITTPKTETVNNEKYFGEVCAFTLFEKNGEEGKSYSVSAFDNLKPKYMDLKKGDFLEVEGELKVRKSDKGVEYYNLVAKGIEKGQVMAANYDFVTGSITESGIELKEVKLKDGAKDKVANGTISIYHGKDKPKEYVKLVAWGDMAAKVVGEIGVHDKVKVMGTIKNEVFVGDDNKEHEVKKITVKDFRVLGKEQEKTKGAEMGV
jgi:hypothetical protein